MIILNDEILEQVAGGIQVTSITPGTTVSRPDGFNNIALSNGKFVGVFNGTSPHLDGSAWPVECIITY
jgi:hypothetical protein